MYDYKLFTAGLHANKAPKTAQGHQISSLHTVKVLEFGRLNYILRIEQGG